MKYLLMLLISSICYSQNNEKLCNLSYDGMMNEVSNIGKLTKSHIVDVKENKNFKVFIFTLAPTSITKDQYLKMKENQESCNDCYKVQFSYYLKGDNKDLKIEGIPTYSLKNLNAHFLTLLPLWQYYFRPDVNTENYNNSNNLEYRVDGRLQSMLYNRGEGYYELQHFTCL